MNTLTLIIGILLTVAFVLYTKKVATKSYNKKSVTILATIVAPIVILFLAIYATAHSVVRIALVGNPEMLIDASKELEARAKRKEMEAAKEALKNVSEEDSKYAPIVGNPDGKVVVYEFYDYNCGFCKRGNAALEEVLGSEKDVKVVLKSFPIFPPSQIPGRAIIAAQMQGKAAELHHALFTTNLIPEQNDKASEKDVNEQIKAIVFGAAKKAGLDVDQLKKDMENPAVEEEIIRTRELATKLGIQGTPAFIIGDQFFRGFIEAPAMIEAINQAK